MVQNYGSFLLLEGQKILTFALRKPSLHKMSLRKIDLRKNKDKIVILN